MKNRLLGLLVSLRIFDEDGTLSLSSSVLLVTLVRIAVMQSIDWVDLLALLLGLLNYNARKAFRLLVKIRKEAELDRISQLEVMVREMRTANALKR